MDLVKTQVSIFDDEPQPDDALLEQEVEKEGISRKLTFGLESLYP